MILQHTHQVVDCPICGRPLEIEFQLVSHKIACGHCRGEFTVYETEEGLKAGANREGAGLLERAEELLRAASNLRTSVADRRSRRALSSNLSFDHTELPGNSWFFPREEYSVGNDVRDFVGA